MYPYIAVAPNILPLHPEIMPQRTQILPQYSLACLSPEIPPFPACRFYRIIHIFTAASSGKAADR
jgi:hypothetical protein